jgi:hypothetical protein
MAVFPHRCLSFHPNYSDIPVKHPILDPLGSFHGERFATSLARTRILNLTSSMEGRLR